VANIVSWIAWLWFYRPRSHAEWLCLVRARHLESVPKGAGKCPVSQFAVTVWLKRALLKGAGQCPVSQFGVI